MARKMIDPDKIMRIFRLAACGQNPCQIARAVGVAQNTVRHHLAGEYLYPHSLAERLQRLAPALQPKHYPGYITLAEASYLIPTRPSSRSVGILCFRGHIESTIIDRTRYTKAAWVNEYVRSRWPDGPTGLMVHVAAVPHLLTRRPTVEYRVAVKPISAYGTQVVPVPTLTELGQRFGNPIRNDREIVRLALDLLERCHGTVILWRNDFTRTKVQQMVTHADGV